MSRDLMILFAIAMALMVMQMIGGFLQIRRYRKAVSRVCSQAWKCGHGTKAWLVL